MERDLADRQGARGGEGADDVRVVLLVRREDRDDQLDVVLVALGEQRADRTVRQARGEDRRLRRARLALDEPARDLARGVHPLLEVDGEREEVEAGAGLGTVGRPEDHRVAEPDRDGAACEQGDAAGLDGQRTTGKLGLEDLWHWVQILSAVQRDRTWRGSTRSYPLDPLPCLGGAACEASGGVRAVR